MNKIWTALIKPRSWIAKWLLAIFAIGFLFLELLDYLQPIQDFLDAEQLSFKVGTIRLSAYFIIKIIITIMMLFWITGILSDFIETRIKAIKGIKNSNKPLLTKMLQILTYFLAFVLGLDVIGIDITALAIFSGAIGIGIGFGLQKITSNFISGLIILFEKSIKSDDLLELADGTYGFARHTSARYTLIETFEGKEIMIPNEDLITSRVTNWTYSNNKGRVDINISISYESDVEKAMELILEAANEHPRCAADPEPSCFLVEFADSSINFALFFWVEDVIEGRYEPRSDVMINIWKKFKKHNITIPYPQTDIYIKNKP